MAFISKLAKLIFGCCWFLLHLSTLFNLLFLIVKWKVSLIVLNTILLLLFICHCLELVHLLQLGDLECSMGLTGLHLQVVDLHVPLLHLVLHVELLPEDTAGLVVELLAQSGQIILAHGGDIRHWANTGKDRVRDNHLVVVCREAGKTLTWDVGGWTRREWVAACRVSLAWPG